MTQGSWLISAATAIVVLATGQAWGQQHSTQAGNLKVLTLEANSAQDPEFTRKLALAIAALQKTAFQPCGLITSVAVNGAKCACATNCCGSKECACAAQSCCGQASACGTSCCPTVRVTGVQGAVNGAVASGCGQCGTQTKTFQCAAAEKSCCGSQKCACACCQKTGCCATNTAAACCSGCQKTAKVKKKTKKKTQAQVQPVIIVVMPAGMPSGFPVGPRVMPAPVSGYVPPLPPVTVTMPMPPPVYQAADIKIPAATGAAERIALPPALPSIPLLGRLFDVVTPVPCQTAKATTITGCARCGQVSARAPRAEHSFKVECRLVQTRDKCSMTLLASPTLQVFSGQVGAFESVNPKFGFDLQVIELEKDRVRLNVTVNREKTVEHKSKDDLLVHASSVTSMQTVRVGKVTSLVLDKQGENSERIEFKVTRVQN